MNLRGKRLLVMDRTALAACAVKRAKEMGLYTIVANFYTVEQSPSKQIADESIMIDISDISKMIALVKEKRIDGIFVGWTDSHLPFYEEICRKTGLPCCGTYEQFEVFSNDKRKFKETCKKFGVPCPKTYSLSIEFNEQDLKEIEYPVIVKPADESGGRGMKRCDNEKDLLENYKYLYNRSKSKNVFVEKFIESPTEVFVYYTMQKGNYSLSASFINYTSLPDKNGDRTSTIHMFSPPIIDSYKATAEPSILRMMKSLNLMNGVIMFQGFYDKGNFYFFESGLRMGGEQFYVFSKPLNSISALDLMIEFSVTGEMLSANAQELDNPFYKKSCCNYYVLLKPGTISAITGIEKVSSMKQVLQVATFKHIGDTIDDTSSLDRVIYRIHVMDENSQALAKTLEYISCTINVLDKDGNEMQLEHMTYERALRMASFND